MDVDERGRMRRGNVDRGDVVEDGSEDLDVRRKDGERVCGRGRGEGDREKSEGFGRGDGEEGRERRGEDEGGGVDTLVSYHVERAGTESSAGAKTNRHGSGHDVDGVGLFVEKKVSAKKEVKAC